MGRVVAVGGVGQGMAAKLVLNGLGAHMMTGFSAMLVLGRAPRPRPARHARGHRLGRVLVAALRVEGPRMRARDFAPDFTLKLMHKDQELVLATAAAHGYAMPTLAAIRDVLGRGDRRRLWRRRSLGRGASVRRLGEDEDWLTAPHASER